jgi:energy-coupling factor transport system permease protein
MLLLGMVAALAGLRIGGRRVRRTAYRPDVWTRPETLVAASGLTGAVALAVAGVVDPAGLDPSLVPLAWPTLVPIATAGILVGLLPARLAPPVRATVPDTQANELAPSAVTGTAHP